MIFPAFLDSEGLMLKSEALSQLVCEAAVGLGGRNALKAPSW